MTDFTQTTLDPTTAPVPAEERETMLLLDVTGSMNQPASPGGSSRNSVLQEAIYTVVETLAKEDSQAAHEEGGGGLRTITFADGTATDIGDINPTNLRSKWHSIRWSGGTYIMPGFRKMQQVYAEEFGKEPVASRPKLLSLVITDGEADDTDQFAHTLAQIGGGMYTVIAVVGYGPEHDRALEAYQAVAAQNTHVKVVSLAAETDPQTIADTLLRMIA